MKKIYKISIFLSAIIIIFLAGNFHFAQGKGYFFEQGENFYIFDNLVIGNPITGGGYLIVEENLSGAAGLAGDALIGKNFIIDPSSKVYFCKDLGGANKDCSKKVMAWTETGLNVVDPAFYQIQTQTIEALNNTDLNFNAAKNITASSAVKLTKCFSNDGGQTCNDGELKTHKLFLDNIASLNSKSLSGVDTITLIPGKLKFTKLDLGNLAAQNLCWLASSGATCPPPATGGYQYTWDFSSSAYPGGYAAGGSYVICCNLTIAY